MFRRPQERRELRFLVDQGKSILMLAPRRVGKTWLINRFAEDLRQAGWFVALCDAEGLPTETAFLHHLCGRIEAELTTAGAVKGRLHQAFSQIFGGTSAANWRELLLNTDWKSFAETLVRDLNAGEAPAMILVDELALFVSGLMRHGAERAREFLYHLRALQQRYPRVQWLFTGSIGLDTVARRGNIAGALVDLHHFPLEPLEPAAAKAFVAHLSATGAVMYPFGMGNAAFEAFATGLGWLAPYYVERLAGLIRPTGPADEIGKQTATEADVAAALTAVLTPAYRNYFVTWEEHLSKNFPPAEAKAMRAILGGAARDADGERFDTLTGLQGPPLSASKRQTTRDRINTLLADGYLETIGDGDLARYRFRSGLLRRYWLRYCAG